MLTAVVVVAAISLSSLYVLLLLLLFITPLLPYRLVQPRSSIDCDVVKSQIV